MPILGPLPPVSDLLLRDDLRSPEFPCLLRGRARSSACSPPTIALWKKIAVIGGKKTDRSRKETIRSVNSSESWGRCASFVLCTYSLSRKILPIASWSHCKKRLFFASPLFILTSKWPRIDLNDPSWRRLRLRMADRSDGLNGSIF